MVYGTPAEETLGGKIVMLDKGYMKELDLAFMSHGSPSTSVDEKCMALENFVVTFHGVKSHAAISPEDGRSALDAALLSFHAIEMLRNIHCVHIVRSILMRLLRDFIIYLRVQHS